MHIQVSRRWIDVELDDNFTVEFNRSGNIALVYDGDGPISSAAGFEPIDFFIVGDEGVKPTMLQFTDALLFYARRLGVSTTYRVGA